MTAATVPRADGSGRIRRAVAPVLLATALVVAMNHATLRAVMRGGFSDPDDAMRLVEVRAFMAGQAWFDVGAHRLDPPFGASMHWSRLVDLPMAGFTALFGLVAAPAPAEALARIVVPTLLLAALFIGMARLATVLVGAGARTTAVFGMVLGGATLALFAPGRIGHHAPETVCLVLAVASGLAALDPARARQAGWAGALVALSLAMSLETLPLLAGLAGMIVVLWIWRGIVMARALAWFAGGLAVALPPLFLVTVGPDHWLAPVCDALGAAHLGAGLIGALGCLGLAGWSSRLGTRGLRLGAATLVAAVVVLFVAMAYPACLRSPFAGVDPLVRVTWLNNVVESKPLVDFMRTRPWLGLVIALPTLLGLAGCLFGAYTANEIVRARFVMLAALVAIGFAGGLWQVRVFGSVGPLALCGGLPVVAALRRRLSTGGAALAARLAPIAILPFTTTGWAALLPSDSLVRTSETAGCLAPEAFAPLASLPAGRALAPIDAGSHLLATTRLDVFTAPYHRDNDGNRFAVDAFMAAPDQARALMAARGVTFVLTCPGELDAIADRAPGGLAAMLRAGSVPSFLERLPIAGTPYAVFVPRR